MEMETIEIARKKLFELYAIHDWYFSEDIAE
jgi:hypothetical protein